MSDDFNDISEIAESSKRLFQHIKDRKYLAASKEAFGLGKTLYAQHIKGKTVEIKGKKIPLSAVIVVVLLGIFTLSPSPSTNENKETAAAQVEQTETKKELNSFDKDGIKVYNMRKCDNAACGVLENLNEQNIARIIISLTFHDQSGAVVYEGGVEAIDVAKRSRMQLTIPSEEPFAYFKLIDVTIEK